MRPGTRPTAIEEADDPLAPYRSELRAHCYRMLGSVDDAEDVLQEVGLRAWRARDAFEGRASRRTWLHRIATNACLNELERKERRVLPMDLTAATEEGRSPVAPLTDVAWLEPLPDDPEQRAVDRESVELAFVAAVQHLPPNQRAALLMADVLGFSAPEIAETLGTTAVSVRSALQRARTFIEERVPERSQQETLAALGDERVRRLVERYTLAFEDGDLPAMLALLTDDATWSMPPLPSWYRGRAAIARLLRDGPLSVSWRHRITRANGQPAVGCYAWDPGNERYAAFGLDVLELRGDRIASVVAFLGEERFAAFGLPPALPR